MSNETCGEYSYKESVLYGREDNYSKRSYVALGWMFPAECSCFYQKLEQSVI